MSLLFPYQKRIFESSLSREEIIERLIWKVTRRRKNRFETSMLPFEGTVSDTGFKVSPIINYGNGFSPGFSPVINGRFFSHMGGVRVEVTMRLHNDELILCIVLSSFVGLMGAISIFSPEVDPLKNIVSAFGIWLFGYSIAMFNFRFEAKKAKNLLSEIFKSDAGKAGTKNR